MARFLRQSTVSTVKLGPFVSPSDGITPYTSGAFTVKVGASGGALAARHDATAITHDADGYYFVEVDATDTAAVGRLKLEVPGSAGNYLPVWDDFLVFATAVYDELFGTAAPLTTLGTNAPAGWLNAAAVAAAALNGKGDWSTATPASVAAAVVAAGPVNWPALAITPAGQVSLAPPTDGMTGGPKVMRGPLQLAADDTLTGYTASGAGAHWLVTISGPGEGQRIRILATDGAGNITSYAGTLWTALDSTTGYTRYFDADFRADVGYIVGNAQAATALQAMGRAVFLGVVSADATATQASFTANSTGSPGLDPRNNYYSSVKNLVVFYSGTNIVKTTAVTSYSYSAGVGTFGLGENLPAAPNVGDFFFLISER